MADLKQFPNHFEREKWVFNQHFYEGRTYIALAKELDISPTRVRDIALQWARHVGLSYQDLVEIERTQKLIKRKS